MRVALVHDWLTGMRGGEKCLEAFLLLYPQADIFTLVHVPGTTTPHIESRLHQCSFLQRFPRVKRFYRLLLPLYPFAVEQFDLSGYDLVISLSHAAAKNVRVPPGVPHVCYCFTPMRYVWDQAPAYFGGATPLAQPMLSLLRSWDRRASDRVTHFVAISNFVAARIRRYYGRLADVLYPPVDTAWVTSQRRAGLHSAGSYQAGARRLRERDASEEERGVAFLYAGALVPYKKAALAIHVCNELQEPLWVVGSGSLEKQLRRIAGRTVTFMGRLPGSELAAAYCRCRALLFPGVEDFGMVPIECLAAGRPVIGAARGGLRETLPAVRHWENSSLLPEESCGVFMRRTNNERHALMAAVQYFIENEGRFAAFRCRASAERFAPSSFFEGWRRIAARYEIDPGERVEKDVEAKAAAI